MCCKSKQKRKRAYDKGWQLRRCKKWASLIRKGKCLSEEYKRNDKKLKWKCRKGHVWPADPGNVVRHTKNTDKLPTWCPECRNEELRNSFSKIKNFIESKGGKVLSKAKKYQNGDSVLKIKCKFGHIFHKKWKKLVSGQFCSDCNSYSCERICRAIFNTIFETPFVKKRFEGLVSEKGSQLELDGYAEVFWKGKWIKIAFEHHGRQHYDKNSRFHKTQKDFEKARRRDEIKREWCKANGVILIEIPALYDKTKINNVLPLIKKELEKYAIRIKIENFKIEDIVNSCWKSPENVERFEKMKSVVESKGGTFLEKAYIKYKLPMRIKCSRGHRYKSSYENIVDKGSGCLKCFFFESSFYSRGIWDRKNGSVSSLIYFKGTPKSLGVFKTKQNAFVAKRVACFLIHIKEVADFTKIKETARKSVKHSKLIMRILQKDPKLNEIMKTL